MIQTDGHPTIASKDSDALLAQEFSDAKALRNLALARGEECIDCPGAQCGDCPRWRDEDDGGGVCQCTSTHWRKDCPDHGEQRTTVSELIVSDQTKQWATGAKSALSLLCDALKQKFGAGGSITILDLSLICNDIIDAVDGDPELSGR